MLRAYVDVCQHVYRQSLHESCRGVHPGFERALLRPEGCTPMLVWSDARDAPVRPQRNAMSDRLITALLGHDPGALAEDVSLATPLTSLRITGRDAVVVALSV